MICNIFISHCWKISEDYDTIVNWLDESSLVLRNMSIPKHNPKDATNDNELKKLIDNNIRESSIFLIISSMHISQPKNKWLSIELEIAKKYDKPIIAIKPWGNKKNANNHC